jgi:NDP-sugar pyrophosphorylase family protein
VDPDYLPSLIGDFTIPVVKKAIYGTLQNDRAEMTFRESFQDVITNDDSKLYLFFPVKSRFNFNGSDIGSLERLQEAVNDVVLKDLKINEKIWNGFGTKKHSTYFGSQFVIGKGSADTAETTGTGWHCAAGNNYFIQVQIICKIVRRI